MEEDDGGVSTRSQLHNDDENMDQNFEDEFIIPPPPATAFQANADGSRLIITRIVNENFKSYAGRQELGPFHKYFTAIIGPNGSGKSNVIDSMLFVFGYRASRIRTKKVAALLHDSMNHGKAKSCSVSVHFALMKDIPEEPDKYELVPGSEFYISRTAFADNTTHYAINGKKCTHKEVSNLLRKQGIDIDHNRFLILQGEVELISLMKPKGQKEEDTEMLEYLEDIIGSSRFKEPIKKVEERVKDQTDIRADKWERCKLARTDLEQLQGPMEAALRYVQLENAITVLDSQLLQLKIAKGEEDKTEKATTWKGTEERMKALKKSLEEKRNEIKAMEEGNSAKTKELERIATLKDKAKADFEACSLRDEAIKEEIERTNKKRKETAKNLANEEEKKLKLMKVPEKNQETIAELETLEPKLEEARVAAEEKHAQVMASLQVDTQSLQDQKETLQTELAVLRKEVDKAKSKHDVANTELTIYTSQEANEVKKLQDIKNRLSETVSGLALKEKELSELKSNVTTTESKLKSNETELAKLRVDENAAEGERRKFQLGVEEARSAMHSTRGRGKVLDSLMKAKASGELPGVFGRMGDLGGIDAKYDVAISTACGPLDNIVVDTVDTAEQCIQFLKRNNIGSATFVALDKQERFREVYSRPFKSPEGVPRLFDLVQVADERVRPVFYFALQDTLVATNLDQASRIAYGATRYRVVTLGGELIEIAGTMSGGGNQVLRGRMGRKVEQQTDTVSPKQLEQMEHKLEELSSRIRQLRSQISSMEETIQTDKVGLTQLRQKLNKLNIEIQSLKSQEPMLRNQLKAQEIKTKEVTPDPVKLDQLTKVVSEAKKELSAAEKTAGVVDAKVEKLTTEIMAKTKGRLDAAQKILDEATEKLNKVRQEKTKLKVAMTTAARNLKKCEEKIANMEQEIETCADRIKTRAKEMEVLDEEAKQKLDEFRKYNNELTELDKNDEEYREKMDKLLKDENTLKSDEIDLKQEMSKAKAELEAKAYKIAADRKRLKGLTLTEEPFTEQQPEIKTLTPEELEALDLDKLTREIKNKEESLPKERPNLGALQEYKKRQKVVLEREKELEAATEARNKSRAFLEQLKTSRYNEFVAGFQVITLKVKECYQMLAEGGDAELEFVNSCDPFSDGIKFTVRPPKKSWREMEFLSGGEKTLASLSLIFALHYYKPTPLYFMDEIDSALDWKNTAIVGFYIKEQTKNAQFIVVSLRENMFEIADQLVGIYKTENCTKSVSIVPRSYNQDNQPSTSGEVPPVA